MNEPKRYCSLSLDLDNQWSYMKIHGDAGWQDFPSYLDIFIPHILEILRDMNLKITFFVVGQDAALPKHTDLLRSIVENGHEIGNHSFHHESWLHLYSREKIEHEILLAEEHIMKATRQKPIGFRGPGFSWSHDILSVLVENGYLYDASTLP
ncbi:polysaccharide deacetylase, partial [candidate division KSB1 bacterium]